MRVYDIIALNEELDVKPGVLGSDGKPVSWQVVDKQTGRVAQTFSGPDGDGKAEEFRDAENAKRRGVSSGPAASKTDPATDPKTDPNAKTAPPEKFENKWQKFMGSKWVKFLAKYAGINAAVYVQLRRDLEKIYNDYWVAKTISEEEYEKRSKALFGAFVATVLSPLLIKAMTSGAKLFLSGFRTWNAASSLVMGSTILGGGIAVLKFVLFEAAAWVAIIALSTSSSVQKVFTDWIIEGFASDYMAEFSNLAKGTVQTIGSALDSKTVYNASRDLESMVNLSPEELRRMAIKNGIKITPDEATTTRRSGQAMDLD
jgi:hypothetical protein